MLPMEKVKVLNKILIMARGEQIQANIAQFGSDDEALYTFLKKCMGSSNKELSGAAVAFAKDLGFISKDSQKDDLSNLTAAQEQQIKSLISNEILDLIRPLGSVLYSNMEKESKSIKELLGKTHSLLLEQVGQEAASKFGNKLKIKLKSIL